MDGHISSSSFTKSSSLAPPRNLGPKQQFRNLINLTILRNMLVFSFINLVSARYRDLIGKIYSTINPELLGFIRWIIP